MNPHTSGPSKGSDRNTVARWRSAAGAVAVFGMVSTGVAAEVALVPSAASAVTAPVTWPAATAWTAYTRADGSIVADTRGDVSPSFLDIDSAGGSSGNVGPKASALFASDGANAYFRLRLQGANASASKGGLSDGVFLVQIADANGVVRAVVGVDGTSNTTDYVYVASPDGSVVNPIYSTVTDSRGVGSIPGARWISSNDGEYFLDFQVPLSAITTVAGGALKSTSAVKLYFGTSASNTGLSRVKPGKDLMLGRAATVDFSGLSTIRFVEPARYTVSFDAGDAGAVQPQVVIDGEDATEPDAPVREGYRFDGWYTEAGQFDFATPVTGDLTLTARWTKLHAVTFDGNGGSAVEAQTVADGEDATRPEDPTRDRYAFDGWYTEAGPFDFGTPVDADTTLTAHWTKLPYAVTFDADGGSAVETQNVAEGADATEPATPTRDGYRFDGWYADGEPFDFATPIDGDVALVAHWTKLDTVTFDADGGSTVDPQTVPEGATATEPAAPTRDGYRFDGWFTEGGEFDFAGGISGDTLLTARWTKLHTVAFDSDGGSAVEAQDVPDGDQATTPADPTRDRYVFGGWYTADGAFDFGSTIGADTTLTAHWTKVSFAVTFDANGADPVEGQTVTDGEDATAPTAPARAGYRFDGWYTEAGEFDFATPVTADTALQAHWTKLHSITFAAAGAARVEAQTVADGDVASEPVVPVRDGFRFDGWYTEAGKFDFTSPVTSDATLTAHWTALSAPVTPVTDADGDGLADTLEAQLGTDPTKADTDGDGLTDGHEVRGLWMRLREIRRHRVIKVDVVKTDPTKADTDGDGLTDGQEVRGVLGHGTTKTYRSNPLVQDSDNDGLSDKVEVTGSANTKFGRTASNPLNWDTDRGGMSDYREIQTGTNPARPGRK